jgi:molybdopterin converting factor small subunit
MKQVRVQYFALLREQAKRGEEKVETAAGTPAALYAELARRHGFTLAAEQVMRRWTKEPEWLLFLPLREVEAQTWLAVQKRDEIQNVP